MDIGGIGLGPDATDVFMEGLYMILKLIDQGVVNDPSSTSSVGASRTGPGARPNIAASVASPPISSSI
jgi:hypothetical protein